MQLLSLTGSTLFPSVGTESLMTSKTSVTHSLLSLVSSITEKLFTKKTSIKTKQSKTKTALLSKTGFPFSLNKVKV